MANLTVTIDDDLLLRARVRALQQGTSVNALLREYLEAYAGNQATAQAAHDVVAMAKRLRTGSGKRGRTWARDELHER